MAETFDVAVVGGGILGLATSLALTERFPGVRVVVVEKESGIARHQTGRNSGVIHSGLYYRPGSLKAQLCVSGAELLIAFCRENGVPFGREGKVVVATDKGELPALDELERRGKANGLPGVRRIGGGELREIEPHARGLAALHVPSTGTVDFGQVAAAMADVLASRDGFVWTDFRLTSIAPTTRHLALRSADAEIVAGGVVNCAGLHADRVARMMDVDPGLRIVPFRGEYYDVVGESGRLVRTSIYPVPDPSLPFLGVHLTHTVAGAVHAGPNAVLALAREGYRWGTIRPGELWDAVSYPGFLRLARRHWKAGLAEVARSFSKRLFSRSVRRLVPEVARADLRRGRPGVRAQALGRDGSLIDDFRVLASERAVHVLNAPSPAATASLAIGRYVVDRWAGLLGIE